MKRTERLDSKVNTFVKTSPEWEGYSRGDEMKIVGERGSFAFVGFCENLQSGETWVALFGGDKDPGGRHNMRYVSPDKVKGASRRRKVNG